MFGWYYPTMPRRSSPIRTAGSSSTDGRNHLELSTEHFDIIVTDPPPPIESSGASVISSYEYYQAGHAHLTPGGIMMQWVPYGAPEDEFKDHVRTFAAVYPHVMRHQGRGRLRRLHARVRSEPMSFEPDAIREVLARPGILEDISSAYDSPATTVDAWVAVIARSTGSTTTEVDGLRRRRAADHRRPSAPRVLPVAPAVRPR